MSRDPPDADRIAREGRGRLSEHVASAYLVFYGHRILARRHRTPYGEIDIIARRGRRIAFVEVKYRRTHEAAQAALRSNQARRVARAAAFWISRYLAYEDYEQGFDAIFVLPWTWPVLVPDAYQPIGTSGPMW